MTKPKTSGKLIPRGVRLNNPLNLREYEGDKTVWLYERATDDDKEFEEFDIPEGGYRAASINFRTYKNKHGIDTPRALVSKWAPPKGKDATGKTYYQDTQAYITVVCNALSVDHDSTIDLENWDTVFALLKAMARHENGPAPKGWEGRTDGTWHSDAVILRGMELARVQRGTVTQQVTQSPTVQSAAVSVAGGAVLGVSEMLKIAEAGKGFSDVDTMSIVRIAVVIVIVIGSLYIINRRREHAKG